MVKLREYQPGDCGEMAELFYDTIHSVNRKDYPQEQLDAWADGNVDLEAWDRSFREHFTVVAEENGVITGFGDIDRSGYLDRLYVHRDFQRKGIAASICGCLETWAREQNKGEDGCEFTTHASVTARPFFEHRGYRVVNKQQVERKGQKLVNYVMVKR